MHTFFIYSIHLILLVGLVLLLWRFVQQLLPLILYASALMAKVLAGVALGLLYLYHYDGGDTWGYYLQASEWAALSFEDFWLEITMQLESSQSVRAIWFTRMVAVFIYVTKVDYWLCATYFSLLSFAASLYAVHAFSLWRSELKTASIVAFMMIPSLVFWSSGLLKESLGYAALMIVLGFYAKSRSEQKLGVADYMLFALGLIFLVMIKYYIAALLLPALAFLWLFYGKSFFWWGWRPISHAAVILLVLLVPAYLFVLWLSPNFYGAEIFRVIQENHDWMLDRSSEASSLSGLGYDGFVGVLLEGIYYSFSALFRPLFYESMSFPAVLSGIENLAILLLVAWVCVKGESRVSGLRAELIVGIIFVLGCGVLLAYSVPNLGTIARYKVYYMPILLLIVFSRLPRFFDSSK